jgi:endonuclease V-like protein UPF0215 family
MAKFRKIKSEIRIIGVDDGAFTPHTTEEVYVVGVVFRGGYSFDGVLWATVKVDGLEATERIANMITNSSHYGQLRVVMLDGVTFAGFNVVDIQKLHRITSLPVLAITRNRPCLNDVKSAIHKISNPNERLTALSSAGEMLEIETRRETRIFVHRAGISKVDTKKIIAISSTQSSIPEPLRVAHMIASSLSKMERQQNKKI